MGSNSCQYMIFKDSDIMEYEHNGYQYFKIYPYVIQSKSRCCFLEANVLWEQWSDVREFKDRAPLCHANVCCSMDPAHVLVFQFGWNRMNSHEFASTYTFLQPDFKGFPSFHVRPCAVVDRWLKKLKWSFVPWPYLSFDIPRHMFLYDHMFGMPRFRVHLWEWGSKVAWKLHFQLMLS